MSPQTPTSVQVPPVLGGYHLYQLLESNAPTHIYLATDYETGIDVALKVEHHLKATSRSAIQYEQKIYSHLPAKSEGIPQFFSGGSLGGWEYIGVELLGPSVATLLAESGRSSLELHSVCCLGMQLIDRLALLHDHGILHRDIKPENCVIGLTPGTEQTIYLTNFGCGKYIRHPLRFMNDGDLQMGFFTYIIPPFVTTLAYTYRDDFEALALTLIHLIKPYGLPWARRGMLRQEDRLGQQLLSTAKANTAMEGLCSNIPTIFKDFLLYCRSMKVNEYPDYQQWRDRLSEPIVEKGYEAASPFYWPPLPLPSSPRASRHHSPVFISPQETHHLSLSPIPLHLPTLPAHSPQDDFHELLLGGHATKAALIKILRFDILPFANSNRKLADVVLQFCDVLQFHRNGPYITKDGFEFLNQLINKLSGGLEGVWHFDKEEGFVAVKLAELEDLRDEVRAARNKQQLAKMVICFGEAHRGKHDKKATKNGFKFLQGLAARLKTL
ncbi:hypothetical protein PC9H_000331 [Pleurotus ostreatus]|uniref:non-specific serine/threonine protein kinase n=1 Tax=Pleurotus ostreatus TaxID=5322 RepID=A0A8H7A3Z1_PLEOS|nr:uncharacterized protein PC9H_000331 [Pleurotus ostreatus]KAF7439994.1 hypothetical protein PC9H_000331 [Pleurotus ostreatus]